jgi:D-alanine-D-alanine ligase-like ATP-grasp enzyme
MKGIKVSVVKGFKLNKAEYENNKKLTDFKLRVLKFPVVIKPVSGGSSIGLFIANNDAEFVEKISEAFMFDNEILVERYVSGAREFNVAVMGDRGKIQVSEIDEPLKSDEILIFINTTFHTTGPFNLFFWKVSPL